MHSERMKYQGLRDQRALGAEFDLTLRSIANASCNRAVLHKANTSQLKVVIPWWRCHHIWRSTQNTAASGYNFLVLSPQKNRTNWTFQTYSYTSHKKPPHVALAQIRFSAPRLPATEPQHAHAFQAGTCSPGYDANSWWLLPDQAFQSARI